MRFYPSKCMHDIKYYIRIQKNIQYNILICLKIKLQAEFKY